MNQITRLLLPFTLILCMGQCVNAQQHQEADASHQAQANEYFEKISNMPYSDYYGGSYITAEGKWVVIIAGDQVKGRKSVAKQVGSNNFVTIPGKYSYKTLKKILDDLNAFMLNKANDSITGNTDAWGINQYINRVEMELGEFTPERVKEFKKNIMDSPAIVFKKSGGRIQEL